VRTSKKRETKQIKQKQKGNLCNLDDDDHNSNNNNNNNNNNVTVLLKTLLSNGSINTQRPNTHE
jgi:hypothetical protein